MTSPVPEVVRNTLPSKLSGSHWQSPVVHGVSDAEKGHKLLDAANKSQGPDVNREGKREHEIHQGGYWNPWFTYERICRRAFTKLPWTAALPILCEKKLNDKKTNQQWGLWQGSQAQATAEVRPYSARLLTASQQVQSEGLETAPKGQPTESWRSNELWDRSTVSARRPNRSGNSAILLQAWGPAPLLRLGTFVLESSVSRNIMQSDLWGLVNTLGDFRRLRTSSHNFGDHSFHSLSILKGLLSLFRYPQKHSLPRHMAALHQWPRAFKENWNRGCL